MAGLHQYAFCMPNQVPAPHAAGNTPSGYQANPNNRALAANAAITPQELGVAGRGLDNRWLMQAAQG
jgi:hypothetical protein